LQSVGIVDELMVYDSERYGGRTIIDGHLRKDLHPDVEWPCSLVDLTDDEADVVLATFDYLTGKADVDHARQAALIQQIQERDAALLEGVLDENEIEAIIGTGGIDGGPRPELEISPELFERHDYLVFYFDNEFDWQVACGRFGVGMVESAPVGKRTIRHRGIGRVLSGADLLRVTE